MVYQMQTTGVNEAMQTTGINTAPSLMGTTATWGDVVTGSRQSLQFDINGEIIKFEGMQIKRLKIMLDEFIQENYPEDLL